MDIQTVQALCQLNNRFYAENHASFSDTRQSAWKGWDGMLPYIEGAGTKMNVLDVACGNMRLVRYLRAAFPLHDIAYTGVDSCAALAEPIDGVLEEGVLADEPDVGPGSISLAFIEADIIGRIVQGQRGFDVDDSSFDLAAAFGFMHHVPSQRLRAEVLRQMVSAVKPGGVVAVAFWQFAEDEKMARRAQVSTGRGCEELGFRLEANDYLLGWNDEPGVYRYCHNFTDREVRELIQGVLGTTCLLADYSADGRTGAMNRYIVLQRQA